MSVSVVKIARSEAADEPTRSRADAVVRISADLDGLLRAPAGPIQVGETQALAVLAEIAGLHFELAAVATRLLAELVVRRAHEDQRDDDRLLTTNEAAAALGVNPRWIRRRARTLPFVRRISGKAIRISEQGMRRWVAGQRAA